MWGIVRIIEELRKLSGNSQLAFLEQNKSDVLKEILEYTYNPHKKYKIDEGKYNKFKIYDDIVKSELTLETWQKFKQILDNLSTIKSAKDEQVYDIKCFIEANEGSYFLKQILFKDLRISMGIKKFQKVWPGFCEQPQVQLAQKWEGQKFNDGRYSRKLDGIRNYTLDGFCYSRSNKLQNREPLNHIIEQLCTLDNFNDYVFDGELIYLNPDGSEDFQKAVSLIRSEKRTDLCDNIYFIIFDVIKKDNFLNKENIVTFEKEYNWLKSYLKIKDEKISWYETKLPNVLLIKQVDETRVDELRKACTDYNWEGLMYRDAQAPYEFKRCKSLLKIKKMHDVELELIDMEEGTGRHAGRLGAFVVKYKDNVVKIGSGFSDDLRVEYWNNKEKYIGEYVKTQYFEETLNIEGKPSLRFPVFLSFRNLSTGEEFLIK